MNSLVYGDKIKITAKANVTNVQGIDFTASLNPDHFEIENVFQVESEKLDHYNGSVEDNQVRIMASNSSGNVVTGNIRIAEIICAVKYVDETVTSEVKCTSILYRDVDNEPGSGSCIPASVEILQEILAISNFVLSFEIEKIE